MLVGPVKWIAAAVVAVISVSALGAMPAAETDPRAKTPLDWLVGQWTFSLGKRTGTRTYQFAAQGYALSWHEEFDNSDITGEGYIGFHASKNRVVSLSIHNRPDALDVLVGHPNAEFDKVVYKPLITSSSDSFEIEWRRVGRDEFTYEAYALAKDGRKRLWTAQFKRSAGDRGHR